MKRLLNGALTSILVLSAVLVGGSSAVADTGPVTLDPNGSQLGRQARVALPGAGSTVLWVTDDQWDSTNSVYLPAVTGYDTATGAVVSGPTQIAGDSYYVNQNHNFSQIFNIGGAGYVIPYDAADTYQVRTAIPPGWACLSAGGGAGSTYPCQPFKIATDPSTLSTASTEYQLPGTGISELTGGTLNGITIMAGQVQYGTAFHAGAAAYYAVHDIGGHPVFETQGSSPNCTALARCYDPFLDPATATTSGEIELAAEPSSNQWYDFQITTVPAVGANIQIQAAGAGGQICLYSDYVQAGDTNEILATRYVTWWNNYCAYKAGHPAVHITNTTYFKNGGWVGIDDNADPNPSSTLPGTPFTCTANLGCTRGNVYNHYLLGATVKVINGTYYAILPYDANSQNWFAATSSAVAGGWAVLKAVPGAANPDSTNTWTWTDLSGNNATTTAPGWDPSPNLSSLHRVLDPPASDPTRLDGNPYVVHNPSTLWSGFDGFIDSYQDEAWPGYTGKPSPTLAGGIDMTIDRYGNVWWAFQCEDTNNNYRLCYLIQDPATKAVLGGGFADGVAGALAAHTSTSDPSPNVFVDANGNVHITTLVGNATQQPWGCAQSLCILDAVTTPTGAGQSSAAWTISRVSQIAAVAEAGQVGDSIIDPSGRHIYSVVAQAATGVAQGTMPQLIYDHVVA